MSMYKNLIVELTGCQPEEAAEVEKIMRLEYRTLDGLSRRRFAEVATSSYAAVKMHQRGRKRSTFKEEIMAFHNSPMQTRIYEMVSQVWESIRRAHADSDYDEKLDSLVQADFAVLAKDKVALAEFNRLGDLAKETICSDVLSAYAF